MTGIRSLLRNIRTRSKQKTGKDSYGSNGLSECTRSNTTRPSQNIDNYGANGLSECANTFSNKKSLESSAPPALPGSSAIIPSESLTPYEDVYGESQPFVQPATSTSPTTHNISYTQTSCSELDAASAVHELDAYHEDETLISSMITPGPREATSGPYNSSPLEIELSRKTTRIRIRPVTVMRCEGANID